MWPLAAASAAQGVAGYFGQQQTNAANRDMMHEQQSFEERMSSTAHQREVVDLKAAGLNPILSAGGGGASTPSVGMAPQTSALQGAISGVDSGLKSATDTMSTLADVRNKNASAKLAEAQANVAVKTGDEKSPWAAASKDADTVYKLLHDKVADYLDRRGITRTNAKDRNWFFGSTPADRPYNIVPAMGAK